MMLAIAASRVLAPFFGTSITTWSILIGIILGSLSLGYFSGEILANKETTVSKLVFIILFSSIYIGLVAFVNVYILRFIHLTISNIVFGTVISTLIFFMPPIVLLGMVSPYIAKLQVNILNKASLTIEKLYALSTLGSVLGIFLSVFALIPFMGTQKFIFLVSIILLITSCVMYFLNHFSKVLAVVSSILFLGLILGFVFNNSLGEKIADVDTRYNRVSISDIQLKNTGQYVRQMLINDENSSMMFLDSDDLVFGCMKFYDTMEHFNKNFHKTLMIGGAGYSYPKHYLSRYPNAVMDVIEIDEKVTDLARKYFNLHDNPRLSIYHQDGRTFLNNTNDKYDVILGDAYSSKTPPFQLFTREAVQRMYDVLNDNGLVILNVGSSIEGNTGKLLRAEYATYKTIFPQVYVFPIRYKDDGSKVQNIMLVAIKSRNVPSFTSNDQDLNSYLQHIWLKEIDADVQIFTDDYAPVEYYCMQLD